LSGLRAALVLVGLSAVLVGGYFGTRLVLDAAGAGGSAPEDPRPGIRGIVAVPAPEAPAAPAPAPASSGKDLGPGGGSGSQVDTASPDTGGGEAQAPVGGETGGGGEAPEGGSQGSDASAGSGAPQPPPEEPQEAPTVRRNPGK
jgi:hypothetical protein